MYDITCLLKSDVSAGKGQWNQANLTTHFSPLSGLYSANSGTFWTNEEKKEDCKLCELSLWRWLCLLLHRGYGLAAYFRGVWCGDLSLETLPGHQLRGDCVAVLSASLKTYMYSNFHFAERHIRIKQAMSWHSTYSNKHKIWLGSSALFITILLSVQPQPRLFTIEGAVFCSRKLTGWDLA